MNNNTFKTFIITGDCHRDFTRFFNYHIAAPADQETGTSDPRRADPEDVAFICLGDFGLNFYNDSSDKKYKKKLSRLGYTFYIVRGNHEMRPERLPNITTFWDKQVSGMVYLEPEYPNIRYFIDGNSYWIPYYDKAEVKLLHTLVIGGAYSVDKYWRLKYLTPIQRLDYNSCAKAGWFMDEQLTDTEMIQIKDRIWDVEYDLILTHTCPKSVQPVDLFLSQVDQNLVDDTMEKFLEWIMQSVPYKYWLWGHYHADRIEGPGMEMFYTDMEPIADIVQRWEDYKKGIPLPWWLNISPSAKKVLDQFQDNKEFEGIWKAKLDK